MEKEPLPRKPLKLRHKRAIIIGFVISILILAAVITTTTLLVLRSSDQGPRGMDFSVLRKLYDEYNSLEKDHKYSGYEVELRFELDSLKGSLKHSGETRTGELVQKKQAPCNLCSSKTIVNIKDCKTAEMFKTHENVEIHRVGNELLVVPSKKEETHMKHWFDGDFVDGSFDTLRDIQKNLLIDALSISFLLENCAAFANRNVSTYKSPIGKAYSQLGEHCYLTFGDLTEEQWKSITIENSLDTVLGSLLQEFKSEEASDAPPAGYEIQFLFDFKEKKWSGSNKKIGTRAKGSPMKMPTLSPCPFCDSTQFFEFQDADFKKQLDDLGVAVVKSKSSRPLIVPKSHMLNWYDDQGEPSGLIPLQKKIMQGAVLLAMRMRTKHSIDATLDSWAFELHCGSHGAQTIPHTHFRFKSSLLDGQWDELKEK